MEKTTRRDFIGAIAAIGALPLIGKSTKQDDWFEDIRTDRYYVLQGGQYGDTGGSGCPGYELGAALIKDMKYWKQSCYLEYNIEYIENRGFYLTPSTYFEEPWRQYDRIYLTKRWLTEFYNRHKDEPLENWKKGYSKYLEKIQKGGL